MKIFMRRILVISIILIVCCFIFIIYIVNRNNNYMINILNEIKDNYEIEDNIEYYNKSNDSYIILTSKHLIVLNEKFEEIVIEDASSIYSWNKENDIVYKNDTLMYEKKKQTTNNIKYFYYDIYDGQLIEEIEIEG